MFYSNRKTEKLRNDLSVITICLAKYVETRPSAIELSFVSMKHRVLYMKTYVVSLLPAI